MILKYFGTTFLLNTSTNTPCVFHVETAWKPPFPCRFNVEYTWCVCRESNCFWEGEHHWNNSTIRSILSTRSNMKMERFAEIVNTWKPSTIFRRILNLRSLSGFSIRLWQWSQPAFTCSKLAKETLEQGVEHIQS